MSVKELNYFELLELKSKVYFMDPENPEEFEEFKESWDDEIQLNHERAKTPEEISNETIYKLFNYIDFVKEDFFCNI